jgi:myo-inositol-1(or 4)-monophosphatase
MTIDFDSTLAPFFESSLRAAGDILLHYFRRPDLVVEAKNVADIVTEADRASEDLLVAAIRDRFPDHGILAEESGHHLGASGFLWMIDPLEATFNYARGLPTWGINLALTRDGEVLAGAFFDPLLSDLYYAEHARPAFLNGKQIRTSRLEDLAEAVVYCSTRANVDLLDNRIRKFRHVGSGGTAYAYVAAGYLDAAVETGGGPWDYAAGRLLIDRAGGCTSTLEASTFKGGDTFLASSPPALHQQLLNLLSE